MKTNYNMYQIKTLVKKLKQSSRNEFDEKLDSEFKNHIESNPETELDIKTFENAIDTANNLYKKYSLGSYRESIRTSRNDLVERVKTEFQYSRQEERDKIGQQFDIVLSKVSSMRNPDKTLEFLKLCGIEFPENIKTEVIIPVDPEFIKSILPKNKMFAAGGQDNE